MIYVKIFATDNRIELEEKINEWIGAQRNSGDLFKIRDIHYSTSTFAAKTDYSAGYDAMLYSAMIVYEIYLTGETKDG